MRKVAIVGAGMAKVTSHWDKSLRTLFAETAIKTLEDAGNPGVDAAYIGNMSAEEFTKQKSIASLLTDFSGLGNIPATRVEAADASGGSALMEGFGAVASGMYDTVLVGGVEKMSEAISSETTEILSMAADQEYETFHGLPLVGAAAMLMRLYMDRFKATREQFAAFTVQMHENASSNPYAQLQFKTTVEKALDARMIADPITLMDCAPAGDGAAALILCPLEKAKKMTDTPVQIIGAGQATDTLALHDREDLLTFKAVSIAAEKAYKMAKITPKDVDVLEIHDSYTITGLISLEDLGFSEKGGAGLLVEEGGITKDSQVPVSPSGGLKARGHPVGATGVYQATEITLQLRGEADGMQVKDAEIGLTESISGIASLANIHIMKRI
ncbi:MAG: thiolase domain-containing protein [Promethearchaeota archaeon]